MSANWAYNLDMLAQNGVIDFDGASFVMGQNPRYIGRPSAPPSPYIGKPPAAQGLKPAEIDEFKQEKTKLPEREEKDYDIVKNPSWKKWAFGVVALGGLIFAGFKAKAIYKWVKDFIKSPSSKFKWDDIKDFTSKKWDATKDFCSKKWDSFKNLFKSTTPKP